MLSDILWMAIFGCFAFFGVTRPYIALCGVVWIDTLKPQDLSYGLLVGKPISLIASAIFLFSFLLNLKEASIPTKRTPLYVLIIFMGWITLTTYYAFFQQNAWFKYNAAFKTMLITLFFPFVLNTRLKMETFVATLVAATSYYLILGGARSLLGQGQYGSALVQTGVRNSGIGETSTLSMVSVMILPLIFYLYKRSQMFCRDKLFKLFLVGLSFSSVLACVGTYARTGLVGLFVLVSLMFMNAKRKAKPLFMGMIALALLLVLAPQEWKARMNTIQTANEEPSALGRIVVWRWTLDFANAHPLMGGGFDAYLANAGLLNQYTKEGDNESVDFNYRAKAFHNIFFEVLGEHGYVGLILFGLILYFCFIMNRQVIKNSNNDSWACLMAKSFNISLIIFCVCGNFIAVAFSQWPYYFLTMSLSLYNFALSHDQAE